MKRYPPLLCICAALCLPFVACDKAAEEPAPAAQTPAPAPATLSDTTFTPEPERQVLPSDRIYFNLTQHAWYAKGEPLVHDGRNFMPSGYPIAASLPEMERTGEYQGVEYYRRADTDSVLFVPVSPGYWQVFRGGPAQR
jgi:hypothetical protein